MPTIYCKSIHLFIHLSFQLYPSINNLYQSIYLFLHLSTYAACLCLFNYYQILLLHEVAQKYRSTVWANTEVRVLLLDILIEE